MLRSETKFRARALQLLYAWEIQGRPTLADVATQLWRLSDGKERGLEHAESLAVTVVAGIDGLDREISSAADNWRLDRIGAVERNILRIGLHELIAARVPARVAIDEAVRLAHWFAGDRAPAFVNGVLDALARHHGRL